MISANEWARIDSLPKGEVDEKDFEQHLQALLSILNDAARYDASSFDRQHIQDCIEGVLRRHLACMRVLKAVQQAERFLVFAISLSIIATLFVLFDIFIYGR